MTTYRIGQVATAIGMTTKALRNWFDRQPALREEQRSDGWKRFTEIDAIVLAVTHALSDLGVPVSSAFSASNEAIRNLVTTPANDVPSIAEALKGKVLWLRSHHLGSGLGPTDFAYETFVKDRGQFEHFPIQSSIDLEEVATTVIGNLQAQTVKTENG